MRLGACVAITVRPCTPLRIAPLLSSSCPLPFPFLRNSDFSPSCLKITRHPALLTQHWCVCHAAVVVLMTCARGGIEVGGIARSCLLRANTLCSAGGCQHGLSCPCSTRSRSASHAWCRTGMARGEQAVRGLNALGRGSAQQAKARTRHMRYVLNRSTDCRRSRLSFPGNIIGSSRPQPTPERDCRALRDRDHIEFRATRASDRQTFHTKTTILFPHAGAWICIKRSSLSMTLAISDTGGTTSPAQAVHETTAPSKQGSGSPFASCEAGTRNVLLRSTALPPQCGRKLKEGLPGPRSATSSEQRSAAVSIAPSWLMRRRDWEAACFPSFNMSHDSPAGPISFRRNKTPDGESETLSSDPRPRIVASLCPAIARASRKRRKLVGSESRASRASGSAGVLLAWPIRSSPDPAIHLFLVSGQKRSRKQCVAHEVCCASADAGDGNVQMEAQCNGWYKDSRPPLMKPRAFHVSLSVQR